MPVWLRYLLATAIVLFAFWVRALTGPVLATYPFLLFFPAIVVISVLFDRGTGLYAVALSTGLAWYYFVPVRGSFQLESPQTAVPLALYVVVALFIALVVEALRATAQRLAATKDTLEKTVALNRLLLLDVNHRVKNHLAAATGLLRLTLKDPSDPDPRAVIEEAARRIEVLGQVYNRLHLGERAILVSARGFLTGLVEDLRMSVVGDRAITLAVESDDVDLGSTQAVPIGLIVNELVENALKYAFPDGRAGQISVRFGCEAGQCRLSVADDGVGFQAKDARLGGGSRLLSAFARQLGARIEQHGPPGTRVEFHFAWVEEVELGAPE